MDNIIYTAIELIVLIGAFLLGKYILPKLKGTELTDLSIITQWAYKLVVNAKNVLDGYDGKYKKEYVTSTLSKIAKDSGINISQIQISALIEEAYDAMKKAESGDVNVDSK